MIKRGKAKTKQKMFLNLLNRQKFKYIFYHSVKHFSSFLILFYSLKYLDY